MFESRTSFWPRDWDRAYRRLYWSEWMDQRRRWWLDVRATPAQVQRLMRRYRFLGGV